MAKKPILIFSEPAIASKDALPSGRTTTHYPNKNRQIERLNREINNLETVLENQTAFLAQSPENLVSEMILVLEIAGTLNDFFGAVSKTEGMEFLSELQQTFSADDDFFTLDKSGERTDKPVLSRLFLTMTNERAISELQQYWRKYKNENNQEEFIRGTSKFKNLFDQLNDLRPYSIEDRLKDTGFIDYLNEFRSNQIERINFEIELVYHRDDARNQRNFELVSRLLQENGGETKARSRCVIPEISYHAFIAEAPLNCFDILSEDTNVKFLKAQQILYFRPVGQAIFFPKQDADLQDVEDVVFDDRNFRPEEPILALLDGLPLENHNKIRDHIIVDDPENYAQTYISSERNHGTAMASLIINGDLNSNEDPLNRPIYVRPILRSYGGIECLPEDKLPIDIVHQAIRRIIEGDGEIGPVAPNVHIINFSVCDPYRPFNTNISSWAKLIDWLSNKYNILFIISAGNYTDDLYLNIPSLDFDQLSSDDIEEKTLMSIVESNFNRKILTPAESINSITVGSTYTDDFEGDEFEPRKSVIINRNTLSPLSRIGFGFNGSIKPDMLMPGGRLAYRKPYLQRDRNLTKLTFDSNTLASHPPGHLCAIPGNEGNLNKAGYLHGTSNSAALTSRLACQLYEMLENYNVDRLNPVLPSEYFTVLIKSLLVHGANWQDAQVKLSSILRDTGQIAPNSLKKHIHPYLGYGSVDFERILYCTDHRVTLLGFGKLTCREDANAHLYSFPLPPSLAGINIEKKLTITLAWLSPLNFNSSNYRQSHLFFNNLSENELIDLERENSDYRMSKKGTVQHDILIGNRADAFIDGDTLSIKISCRKDASGLSINTETRYGLCVTLEIRENVHTEIYEEVRERIRDRVRPRA